MKTVCQYYIILAPMRSPSAFICITNVDYQCFYYFYHRSTRSFIHAMSHIEFSGQRWLSNGTTIHRHNKIMIVRKSYGRDKCVRLRSAHIIIKKYINRFLTYTYIELYIYVIISDATSASNNSIEWAMSMHEYGPTDR